MRFFLNFLIFPFFYILGDSSVLRVGMELSYPPFEMICQNGAPCGISVDLVNAFGVFSGKKIQIENIPFIGLIPSLQNGNINLIISSLTVTEQRKKAIDFSDPYVTTGLCLLLNINSTVNNIDEADLPGKVIVVKSGTSGQLYALTHLPNATVRTLDKESACVLEVIQGKADAFIYDQLSVFTNWQKNKTTTRANLKAFQKEYWAFGVKKGNAELVEEINRFIKKYREEGGFDKLGETYLPEVKKSFKELGVPFVF